MLAIKLQRIGKKHQPSYRVVVAEKRSKTQGPPVEDLGSYNAFTKAFAVKADRVKHWIQTGARPTVSVHNLFVTHKIVEGKKIKLVFKKKEGVADLSAEIPAHASHAGGSAKGDETVAPATPAEAPVASE